MAAETAMEIHRLHTKDRKILHDSNPSSAAVLIDEQFCHEPILTNSILTTRLKSTAPTIQKAIDTLAKLNLIKEVSGKKRGRRYAYQEYLNILTRDTVTTIG